MAMPLVETRALLPWIVVEPVGEGLLARRLLALHFDLDVFGLFVAGHRRAS